MAKDETWVPDTDNPPLLPARMVNEFVYCPRLFHLEWVQKEWADSLETVSGSIEHRRVDIESGDLPSPEDLAGHGGEVRSVTLSSQEEGLVARLDVVVVGEGTTTPIDYKHGRGPEDGGLWDTDRIQLGVQGLLLRSAGYPCGQAGVYYTGSRKRRLITVDEQLIDDVRRAATAARATASRSEPPPPLQDSPKCLGCSLAAICLPDETRETLEPGTVTQVRRLYAARDDATPLYVQSQGARVGKRGDRLLITDRNGEKHTARIKDISQLSLFGSVQISASALAGLLDLGLPVCHFSSGAWFRGMTTAIGARNCAARLHQYAWATHEARCLEAARGFVERKIRNGRTLLRRNGDGDLERVLHALSRQVKEASRATSLQSLLGIEGTAARVYFGAFSTMLKGPAVGEFDFGSRNRRPPRDPVNALLSLAYSVLARDWTVALLSVGLDPYLGLFHKPRHGKPALALDLMEEFRPLIADSVVIQLLNNGEVQKHDFLARGSAVALTPSGRRSFFLAYERRMAHEVRHPRFGYQVSYRRLLEVQARLFSRCLAGELPMYDGFTTR